MASLQDTYLLEAERPAVVAEPRILTPMLAVFLGSTSALAGLELMRQMLVLQPGDQRKVALVYIDTDDPPAPLVEFRRLYNNIFQEFPLRIAVPTGISEADRIDTADQHTYIEEKVPQYFANGAGGIRNNGHVAACFNHQYIYDILDRALVSISHLGNEQNASQVQEIQANIVAFLGGGTGSGTIVDVAVIVRELLSRYQYKQRLNLFCMLPEPIAGASLNDLGWRKSNATAGLLEILAYSRAAAKDPVAGYRKQMRGKVHRLTNDPIANEVYLIGHSSMDDSGNTARIVGLDLFQRTTDASGVGFLEHSKWVDRRALGSNDNRGLPTMFGTSCPLEVRFPVNETATAFAQISASYLLPLLASFQPASVSISEDEKRIWMRNWNKIARFDASTGTPDPMAIKVQEFRRTDFEDAAQAQLDILWGRLERFERVTEQRIKEIFETKKREELNRIQNVPLLEVDGGGSLIDRRIRSLKLLQQEYTTALEDMAERDAPRVPRRPNELESKLVRQPQLPGLLKGLARDYASLVCEEYNKRLRMHALSIRYRLLEKLLKELQASTQDALNLSMSWLHDADADERVKDLREKGETSMAWQGKLDYPHPHQRHIFDLSTLRTQSGRNIAVEQLYRWATIGDKAREDTGPIDYSSFINECVAYLARYSPTSGNSKSMVSIDDQIAGRLADRVVEFFKDHYMRQFEDINLIELLNEAAPPQRKGQTRGDQIGGYLLEHLKHVRNLMRSLVAFEAELWTEGLSNLDISVYMGIHWREGSSQEEMIHRTMTQLGPLTKRGQAPIINQSHDPHRLQIAYGQHAISLNTIRDFYLEENSAMQYYQDYQTAWMNSHGRGLMPVHSSGEAQRLVWDKNALGYSESLPDLIIRRPTATNVASPHSAIGANVNAQIPPDPGNNSNGTAQTVPPTGFHDDFDLDNWENQR